MKLYKNIDVVQINIKAGVSEYFLPKNVSWVGKRIKNLFVYAANYSEDPDYTECSPVDGVTRLIDYNGIPEIFFDLYADDGSVITQNLCAQNFIYTNNNPLSIDHVLSLQLSRIFFANTPVVSGALLLYFSWDNKDVDANYPQKNVTVSFDVPNGKDTVLSDVIDTYIHAQKARVKGVLYWGTLMDGANNYITLRNTDYKTIINNLPLNMCRPQQNVSNDINISAAENLQVNSIFLDSEDIDFANSYLRNTNPTEGYSSIILTFLY